MVMLEPMRVLTQKQLKLSFALRGQVLVAILTLQEAGAQLG